ncbi:ABC transporter ATP-binding protein [Shewanella sp. Isolate11]|uniref:ABC transporter ATP-binding protein n=1 Tax=Shewanella sp. Isolate11 TaxID=2908530 RepID=UPI001EFE1367|nr:ABC transporter ATP-binding protein [Shewanella sp. Isolate11]MCG9696963.1 ABC transporter ATP-binding protein [Shewanella sp. Isolate11]
MKMICCQNVSKLYGNKRALNDVSFDIDAGQAIALVGPNGAGKTTLFSLLCGYISPSQGEINIMGHKPGDSALLGNVAALPQDARLDPNLTVLTQLSFFAQLQGFNKSSAKQEALRVLNLVNLLDVAEQKPLALSHGMGKRIAIAQALIGSPQLVLLDEPTAGLDPVNAKAIRELIRSQSSQTTFIISSHNLDELEKLCDKVLYLDLGVLNQSVSIKDNQAEDYLTLAMQQCDSERLIAILSTWPQVKSVKSNQYHEFVLHYEVLQGFQIEQQLLNLFSEQGWSYKTIQRGRTLEDKLFSN